MKQVHRKSDDLPTRDQPQAIDALVAGLASGEAHAKAASCFFE